MGVKISNLPAIVTPALTDVFPVVQAGVTYKETMTQLSSLLGLPVAVGAAGTILRSDGASWVASTSTFADTYAINTILYNASADTVSGLAATARGVLVSNNSSVPSMLASATTTGQILQGSTTGTPTWSTPTYPSASGTAGTILRSNGTNNVYSTATFADTYNVSTILYANAANAVSGLATTARAVMTTNTSGVPQWDALVDGQVIIGSTAGTPTAATLTAGTGITITNASNSITIDADAGGLEWSGVAGTSQAAAIDSGYVVQNALQTTITLPAVADLGSTVAIQGLGAAGWILTANGGQTIQVGSAATSAGGTVTSANQWDSIVVVCVVANTTWAMQSSVTAGFTLA